MQLKKFNNLLDIINEKCLNFFLKKKCIIFKSLFWEGGITYFNIHETKWAKYQ